MRIEYIALPVRDAACIEAIEYADDPDWPCIDQLFARGENLRAISIRQPGRARSVWMARRKLDLAA